MITIRYIFYYCKNIVSYDNFLYVYGLNILHISDIMFTISLPNTQDKYQRTLADRENVRLRLEKQIVDAKQYGIQGFCKDLLEVSID